MNPCSNQEKETTLIFGSKDRAIFFAIEIGPRSPLRFLCIPARDIELVFPRRTNGFLAIQHLTLKVQTKAPLRFLDALMRHGDQLTVQVRSMHDRFPLRERTGFIV